MKRVALAALGLLLVAFVGFYLLNGVFGWARLAMTVAPSSTRQLAASIDGYLRSISQRELTYYGVTVEGNTLVVWLEVEAAPRQRQMYADAAQAAVAQQKRSRIRTIQVRNYMTGDELLDSLTLR